MWSKSFICNGLAWRVLQRTRLRQHQSDGRNGACFVQALANCRDFGVDSAAGGLSFQLLTIGALIALLSDVSCDCDEGPDAEDHEKGKRSSGF